MGISMMTNLVGGKAILISMKFAVMPIAKVLTMCFMGFLMASKRVNILSSSGRKLLNSLVFSLLLPCLIFSQLGRAITLQRMMEWWFIPVNIVLATVSGSLIGLLVAWIIRPPYPYFKFTIIHIGIGNIGNIPLVLISALCRDASNPFGNSEKCSEDGTAYISFGQWVGAIVLYTYVFQMLSPPPGGSIDCSKQSSLPVKNFIPDHHHPGLEPLLNVKESEPLDLNFTNTEKAIEEDLIGLKNLHDISHGSLTLEKPRKMTYTMFLLVEKLRLKQILQPPIIASILAMVVGAVSFLKNLILTDDAPLFFITDSCIVLGEAMIPCILLALGGNLIDGPGSSKLGVRTTMGIVAGRLVLVPLGGIGIVSLADKLGFLPSGNKMFKFVLLLQHSMPTSILSGAVANLRGYGQESASTLFWVHIFSIFSMAGWIVIYLNLLF